MTRAPGPFSYATSQNPQDSRELMSERRVLRVNAAPRLEWRSQDGQDEPVSLPQTSSGSGSRDGCRPLTRAAPCLTFSFRPRADRYELPRDNTSQPVS
jgi:hypothetical protein